MHPLVVPVHCYSAELDQVGEELSLRRGCSRAEAVSGGVSQQEPGNAHLVHSNHVRQLVFRK